MKMLVATCFLSLVGCAGFGSQQASQASYVQACGAYSAALQTALELRKDGKLLPAQISAVTTLSEQITPLCSGPLPSNPATMMTKVSSAILTLTALQGVSK